MSSQLQGFSVARYEGSTLVVETTNFMYDPTGLDDMAGLPSSARKKVIERYSREGDVLRAEVTTEDPLFPRWPRDLQDPVAPRASEREDDGVPLRCRRGQTAFAVPAAHLVTGSSDTHAAGAVA